MFAVVSSIDNKLKNIYITLVLYTPLSSIISEIDTKINTFKWKKPLLTLLMNHQIIGSRGSVNKYLFGRTK